MRTALRFQFTRPRGARPVPARWAGSHCGFNSRAREGRDFRRWSGRGARGCFNSRAREGRDRLTDERDEARAVSIHAPARGATTVPIWPRPRSGVSIHAPARGATQYVKSMIQYWQFQFTRPRGARRKAGDLSGDPVDRFNSRAREGRDVACGSAVADGSPFQFTRPRGARPPVIRPAVERCWFQFTRPRGARPGIFAPTAVEAEFQFTRPRGARLSARRKCRSV